MTTASRWATGRAFAAAFFLTLASLSVAPIAYADEGKRCYCRAGPGLNCAEGQLANPYVDNVGWSVPTVLETEGLCRAYCEQQFGVSGGYMSESNRGEWWEWGDNVCEYEVQACRWYACDKTPSGQCVDDGMLLEQCPTQETSCQPKADDADCFQAEGGGEATRPKAYCVCKYPDTYSPVDCRRKTVYLAVDDEGADCSQVCEAGFGDGRLDTFLPATTKDQSYCSFLPTGADKGCSAPTAPIPLDGQSSADRTTNLKACDDKWLANNLDCNCKYRDDYPTETCRGKEVWAGRVWANDETWPTCKLLCDPEPVFRTVDNYRLDSCTFHVLHQGCAVPLHPEAPSCAGVSTEPVEVIDKATQDAINKAAAEKWRQQVNTQGVALGQSLPLGNRSPQAVIGRIISTLLGIVGGVALLFFVVGGIQWMTAAGNPERLKTAKATVLWSILGLVVIFGAYAIVNFLITSLTG